MVFGSVAVLSSGLGFLILVRLQEREKKRCFKMPRVDELGSLSELR